VTPKERAGRQLFEEFLSELDLFWERWEALAYEDFDSEPYVNCEDFAIPEHRLLRRYFDNYRTVQQHFEELAIKRGLVHGGFVERS